MNQVPVKVPELVPVFPLPEAVLFPRQVLPLHIFEPRYCTMVADAMAGDRLVAVALLKPNYEPEYFTPHAPIHRLAGVGRIIASEQLDGGKFNILLRGQFRAYLLDELPGRPYRRARMQAPQSYCQCPPATRARLRCDLLDAVRQHVKTHGDACQQYLQLFEAPLSLGELADLIAGGLPVVGELRQSLLAQLEAGARAQMLLEHLHTLLSMAPPPRVSDLREAWSLN